MTSPIQSRRLLLQAAAASLALPAFTLARAQGGYPSKAVKLIVPLPSGGVADNSARALVNTMQARNFGQPIVIENKPGGAFMVAINAIKSAPADGYTLLQVNKAMLSVQSIYGKFDLSRDYVPIAGSGETDVTFSVTGKRPFKTIKELIDFGKANPGKLSYVSPGAGSLEHLALANFCKRYGIDALHVPVKGGVDVVKMLVQGEGDFGSLAVPLVQQFGQQGAVRPLVLFSEKRNAALPEVPTYVEEKLDLPRLTLWAGLAAPAGTPKEVIAVLEKAVVAALADPALQKTLVSAGMTPAAIPADTFAKMWRDDLGWISKVAAEVKPTLTN